MTKNELEILRQDFPYDFADEDPFTAALLDVKSPEKCIVKHKSKNPTAGKKAKKTYGGNNMNRRNFTDAEKKAFNAGRISYYNQIRPKVNYEVVSKHTYYDEDGSIRSSFTGKPTACASKKLRMNIVRI